MKILHAITIRLVILHFCILVLFLLVCYCFIVFLDSDSVLRTYFVEETLQTQDQMIRNMN